jgi:competence protein ComEA
MIKNISQKLGLTTIEFRLISFVIFSFIVGILANQFLGITNKTNPSQFSYSYQDSLFFYDNDENNSETGESNLVSKQEVLDFNEAKINTFSKKILPAEKSININNATKSDLMKLPGIGEKTAEAIIQMREKNGKFRKLEELKKVKGIGDKKFEKIIKYIFI